VATSLKTQPSVDQDLVYAAAIIILADDLYPRKLEIVREYIQNSSDAIDAFERISEHIEDDTAPLIKISIQGKSLLVYDNGIGMDAAEVSKLKRIAYSEKREGAEAGHKGIGRLAGIAVANKLIISSTSYGDPQLHKFEFRAKEMRDELVANKRKGISEPATVVINRHTTISAFDVDPREHYTMVELREIDEKHPELLDTQSLREFIGDMAPVGFAPDFSYGQRITQKLFDNVPDYSPKTVWLATSSGDRAQVYKPYDDSMSLAEPEFIEISDESELLGYCWCAVKGKEMLGKIRPAGNKFSIAGESAEQKKRLAGLVYKLFGFSIGDRNLPLETLWTKDYTRALWFTGEIHIVNKSIRPTTDRSDFVDNEDRGQFYDLARTRIAKKLNQLAQEISNGRQAFDDAKKCETRFKELTKRLDNGGIERTELKARREELHKAIEGLSNRRSKDQEIQAFLKRISQQGKELQKRLSDGKSRKESNDQISDLAKELQMTSHARKVYTIIMEAIGHYFGKDKDSYYELSAAISKALKQRY
jgi:hypothetical protein